MGIFKKKIMQVNPEVLNQLPADVAKLAVSEAADWNSLQDAADLLCNQNKLEEALLIYNRLLKKKPNDLTALANKGLILKKLKKFEEAIECYEKVLKIQPDDWQILLSKGIALKNLKRYKEALKIYDLLLKKHSDSFEVWANKGNVFYDLGNLKEALKCYNSALVINPKSKEVQGWKWDVVGALETKEDKSGKKYESDHQVIQFRRGTDIKKEAQKLCDKWSGKGAEIRINPAYKDDEFRQVVEVKGKIDWRIMLELLK